MIQNLFFEELFYTMFLSITNWVSGCKEQLQLCDYGPYTLWFQYKYRHVVIIIHSQLLFAETCSQFVGMGSSGVDQLWLSTEVFYLLASPQWVQHGWHPLKKTMLLRPNKKLFQYVKVSLNPKARGQNIWCFSEEDHCDLESWLDYTAQQQRLRLQEAT